MNAWVARGRQAWPQLAVEPRRFIEYVHARVGGDGDAHIEDLYLACACVDGVADAHRALDDELLAPVSRQVRNAQPDELRQLLRERVLVAAPGELPRLAKYSGKSPLLAWLKVVALRLALNLRRQRRDDLALDEGDAPIVAANPEMMLMQKRFRPHFDIAFADAMARLTVEDRQLLRFYVVERLSVAEIGALHNVDKATISRRLTAARAQLLRWTHEHLRARLGSPDVDLDSLIRLVRSQFRDVSFAKLLD